MTQCMNAYNKILEWVDSDILIRKLINAEYERELVTKWYWSRSQDRGEIVYGNLNIDLKKRNLKIKVYVHWDHHEDLEKLRFLFIENDIQFHTITETYGLPWSINTEISYYNVDFIIKLLPYI